MKREKYTVYEFWIEPAICTFKNFCNTVIRWVCNYQGETVNNLQSNRQVVS